ncbi:c-type cytochrome biogenesis protein CcmI [Vibrio panuliri]|uniref:C-type cytochrome biogenesis protein CcmI n=1 Tax=Vibrio panuliri TaxID=1381081 RepID=A0A1Q9HG66_9VIBR|nr:c-type cytochrome biogenesis protein CcmI [Vibrio panuliri]KAB1454947.1 c-type cytochrome biogenesis protein CcmI [Vibrio panuliri]OLQ88870.1 c-type cytochrome biogenesis protein CcmI [Vibrio panuliri]OLQ96390.1 c-type cytochrome biogenesis protein CcmI [Vibrio panuliri]
MTLFWIASIVLIALSGVMIALPFIKKKENNDAALRDELNKALYKDRLSELEEETEEGLVENQQELIDDLKQSLLDDIPSEKHVSESAALNPWVVIVPSMLLTIAMSYGLYAKFGAADDVAQWQQVSSNLPALSKKLMSPEGAALSDDEMQDLTLALRTRLHVEPKDATGWLLLGRIALANRDIDTAIGAMNKAYTLKNDDPDIMLGYAQALMLSQDPVDQDTARATLGKLVQRNYMDVRVFSLLAFDAYERKDFAAAVRYWSIMQQMIGPQDERYEMLGRSIENAQKQMGIAPSDAKSVSVSINLAPQVTASPDAALIVSVHNADGSPVPVAAARYPLGTFPRTVVLDDGNSMMQGQKLSQLEGYVVRVRIDNDGNVATKEGDWYGESSAAKMGEAVEVTIDKQY